MKLEEQVSSLELSKKLKTLGVKQESLFKWIHDGNGFRVHSLMLEPYPANWIVADAFTVAELGFPLEYVIQKWEDSLESFFTVLKSRSPEKQPSHPMAGILFDRCEPYVREKTEVDARAKMLIHLIETGVVKP